MQSPSFRTLKHQVASAIPLSKFYHFTTLEILEIKGRQNDVSVFNKHNSTWKVLCTVLRTRFLFSEITEISKISDISTTHWHVNNSCVNTVRAHFPWRVVHLFIIIIFQVRKVGSKIYEQGERFILDCDYCTCKGPLYWCKPLCCPPQFPPGTKPIYEEKLVLGTECTCKSNQLGQALKKCFNRNTLLRLQVFICWLSFERENWHDETKAFSTISALFVNTSFSPI